MYEERDRQRTARLTAAERRSIASQVKRLALDAGIRDVNDIDVADLSGLRIEDDGTVRGIEGAIERLKATKPHWFAPEGIVPKARRVRTPERKDLDVSGNDWGKASHEDVSRELRRYGVMR
jgi:hypothetical protein